MSKGLYVYGLTLNHCIVMLIYNPSSTATSIIYHIISELYAVKVSSTTPTQCKSNSILYIRGILHHSMTRGCGG